MLKAPVWGGAEGFHPEAPFQRVVAMQNGPNQQRTPEQPFQFSLFTMLATVTWLSALLAAGAALGALGVAAVVWISSIFVMANSKRFLKPARWVCLGSLLMGLIVLIIPAVQAPQHVSRPRCANELKYLALGLLEYADAHTCFPPAYVADEQGRPMHSWRVHILPYIEEKALYAQYDFSEPWDGPHNRLLASRMPRGFHCPRDGPEGGTTTSYVAVVGPETVWPGSDSMPLRMIKDGMSNTIILVEVANSGINWMEPRDLPFSAVARGINSPHPGGFHVAFADGSARSISSSISRAVLEALFTRAGGEPIPNEY